MTNIALGFASCYICQSTLTLSYIYIRCTYFIQIGGSALNNTYRMFDLGFSTVIPFNTFKLSVLET